MADRRCGVPENVPGAFFVDRTCIDCDTCRQLAPEVFAAAGEYSFVTAQPIDPSQTRRALEALVACPTGSIGGGDAAGAKQAADSFPLQVENDVFYCGFHSPKSYGGASYLVRHPGGNWLVDSPRYVERLARRIEEMGGVRYIFLTHRDDVADAEKYAARFGSERIIHRLELLAQPTAERILDGFEPVTLAPGFVAVPTPGHTAGHCVLLYRERYLFSGDHLWWSPYQNRLTAGRDVCWFSWQQQAASMARLTGFRFEWVLPGHGRRVRLSADEARAEVAALAGRMATAA